ncbi:MAG: DUF2911 domain-containing protein [Cytophagales bacterium]|nr:DUF2911 domain-containing protein [Cytophagales bacterium]
MKKVNHLLFVLLAFAFVLSNDFLNAQNAKPRKSPKATVSQRVGVDTDIVIDYSRPAVKGRTIWGELVPYGMYPGNKYSKEKPFPWRAGANENTTISFNSDVKINGNIVAAGKYGLHMIAGKDEFKIMFNEVNDSWGSYSYDASKDVLSITVKPESVAHTEWLEYGFDELGETGTTVYLKWAELKIPFKIEL